MLSACLYFRIVSSPLNIEWIFKYFTLILWTFFFFNFGRNWEKIILNFSENFMMIKKMSKFHFRYIAEMKSDNLQFSTLVRWDKWLVDQASDVPSIFFIISHRLRALKTLYFYFSKFIKKIKKNKLNWFLQRILQEIMTNTWNIICLVDESFVPANQRIIL